MCPLRYVILGISLLLALIGFAHSYTSQSLLKDNIDEAISNPSEEVDDEVMNSLLLINIVYYITLSNQNA